MDTLNAAHLNIRASVHHLIDGAPILAKRVRDGDMMIVGAEYAVENGLYLDLVQAIAPTAEYQQGYVTP